MSDKYVVQCKKLNGDIHFLRDPDMLDDFSEPPRVALTENISLAYQYKSDRLGQMNGLFDCEKLTEWHRTRDDWADCKLVEA